MSFYHTYLSVFCLCGTVYNALIGMLVLRLHICTSQWSGRDWDLGTQDAKCTRSCISHGKGQVVKSDQTTLYFFALFLESELVIGLGWNFGGKLNVS